MSTEPNVRPIADAAALTGELAASAATAGEGAAVEPGVRALDGAPSAAAAAGLTALADDPAFEAVAPAVALEVLELFDQQLAPADLLAGDRQATVDQTGQRGDHGLRVGRDQLGTKQHRVGIFFGVVVGQDGAAEVRGGAGGAQVARGGEDRVDRVVGVGVAGVERVHAVLQPGRGHELHPADRSGRGDRLVGAVVGLDFVDRRQDLPRHAVLHGRSLVDRQQECGNAVERERLRGGL